MQAQTLSKKHFSVDHDLSKAGKIYMQYLSK